MVIDTYHWKYGTFNLYLMLGFWHNCTDRSKPNVEIKLMSVYPSVQMSIKHQIQLQCLCWQQTVPSRYIKVEANVGYFQWQVSRRDKTWLLQDRVWTAIPVLSWIMWKRMWRMKMTALKSVAVFLGKKTKSKKILAWKSLESRYGAVHFTIVISYIESTVSMDTSWHF